MGEAVENMKNNYLLSICIMFFLATFLFSSIGIVYALETMCDDDIDNDGDSFYDSQDPDCDCINIDLIQDKCYASQSISLEPRTYYLPNGIEIFEDGVVIECNGATLMSDGIVIYTDKDNTVVTNCVLKGQIGIVPDLSLSGTIIKNNEMVVSGGGIIGAGAIMRNGIIENNKITVTGKLGSCLTIGVSTSNSIRNNIITCDGFGVFLRASERSSVVGNKITASFGVELIQPTVCKNSNIIQDNDITVPGTGEGIDISGCSFNNTIIKNRIKGGLINTTMECINLFQTFGNTIRENNIEGCYYGISLVESSNNTLSYNIVKFNDNGISIIFSSGNKVEYNVVCKNSISDIDQAESNYTGIKNTCDLTYSWNDVGAVGCAYKCTSIHVHGKVSVPENSQKPIQNAKVKLNFLDGLMLTTYTDNDGNYNFNDIPKRDFNIVVELKDKSGVIEVYDGYSPWVFYLKTKTIIADKEDMQLDIVFHESYENLAPEIGSLWKKHLDDNAIIYYYTYIAKDFSDKNLNLLLNHFLPVETYTYSYDNVFYDSLVSSINIGESFSDINDWNKPDNREWHEFSHHIMTDSLIGGDNFLPPSTGINHGMYNNSDTVDSWIEGFAVFLPLTIKDYLGLTKPSFYRYQGIEEDLERNYLVWQDEEFAIAGILWDLYDGKNSIDNDTVDLTLTELWNLLNRQNNLNLKKLYDTFNNSGITDLIEDSNHNNLSDLDEVFISHGAFNDLNDNRLWDKGEEIGYTGNSVRPHREDKPPRNDSYLLIKVIDNSSGMLIDSVILVVRETNAPPFDVYNREYNFTNSNLSSKIYFVMPPSHTIASIITKKEGYVDSEPLTINSSYYWANINTGKGYLINHTFYLAPLPCAGDVNLDKKVDIFDLAKIGLCYGCKSGEGCWVNCSVADVKPDNKINIFDLATVGLNYGKSC